MNPLTDHSRLTQLYEARTSSNEVLLAVLSNPNTDSKLIAEEASKGEVDKNEAIWRNPARILGKMTMDPNWINVDYSLASMSYDEDILRELASSPDEEIRKIVAIRNETPDDAKMSLAMDPDESVQEALAESVMFSRYVPVGAQLLLARSPFAQVKVVLATYFDNLEVGEELLKSGDSEVLTVLSERRFMGDIPKKARKMLRQMAEE